MEIKHSGNVWIYLAYSFLLLSYLNVNILFIRLFLIFASCSFICFACIVGNVFVDSVVFNSIFIIINGTYCYLEILKYLPIKLKPLEERIYEKDFKKVMDRRTFRDFIRKAHLRTFSEGGQICHHGNNFSGPFYVAQIKPGFKVTYIKKGKEYFEVKENSWIGVVEYMMYEKEKKIINKEQIKSTKVAISKDEANNALIKKKKAKIKWGLDAIVKEVIDYNNDNVTVADDDTEPCYVYEFPLNELNKLFKDKDEGILWKNALYSIWLGYTTKAIIGVDAKVQVKTLKQKSVLGKSTNKMQVSMPIHVPVSESPKKMDKSRDKKVEREEIESDQKIRLIVNNTDSNRPLNEISQTEIDLEVDDGTKANHVK